MSKNDLFALLAQCRDANVRKGITGMLLYAEQYFIQALEGEKSDVMELFNKIQEDPRNHHLKILLSKDIEERHFPKWSMGFKNISTLELKNIPGLTTFMDNDQDQEANEQLKSEVYKLLLSFKSDPSCFSNRPPI